MVGGVGVVTPPCWGTGIATGESGESTRGRGWAFSWAGWDGVAAGLEGGQVTPTLRDPREGVRR